MRGVVSPYKPIVMDELRKGTPSNVVSRKYGIPLSTLTGWIKELPPDAKPSIYKSKNDRISVMEKVNRAEAKISVLLDDYIICGITDEEWEDLTESIQQILIDLLLTAEVRPTAEPEPVKEEKPKKVRHPKYPDDAFTQLEFDF